MHAALRPYVTAGVALVGSSVIAITPIAPSHPGIRSTDMAVNLTAATTDLCTAGDTSAACNAATERTKFNDTVATLAQITAADPTAPNLFNISANLLIALANVPYNFLNALGAGDVNLGALPNSGFSFQPSYEGIDLNQTGVVGLTANLNYGGSWWVYSPTNVLGTDPADISRYQALMNVLAPFPALSVPLGNILTSILASQLPMNAGCTGTGLGGCDDPIGILSHMFDLRNIVALFSPGGFTFPEVRDPITCDEHGRCDIVNPDGPELPWSGQNVQLDLSAPFTSFYNSLNATPDFSQIRLPSLDMVVNTFANFVNGLNIAFNPFVLGTQCGLCAPFVPNPGGLPVPGPFFPPHDATTLDATTLDATTLDATTLDATTLDATTLDATTLDATTLDATTLDVGLGEEQHGEEQGNEENLNVSDEHDNSLQRTLNTSLQEKTVVTEPDQGLVNTEVEPTTPVDNTDVTPTTSTNVTNDVKPAGQKHSETDGRQSVQETISKVANDLKGGSTTGGSTTGGSTTGGSTTGGSTTGGSTTGGSTTGSNKADDTNKASDTNQGGNTNGDNDKGGEAGSGKHSK